MVLWELFSRSEPYTGMDAQRIAEHVLAGGRPEIPSETPESISTLITRCWDVCSQSERCILMLAAGFASCASVVCGDY